MSTEPTMAPMAEASAASSSSGSCQECAPHLGVIEYITGRSYYVLCDECEDITPECSSRTGAWHLWKEMHR